MASPAPALTSDEITALAGASTRLTYLSVVPNTTVATARVNGSLAYPIAQIPTTSESGGWTNAKAGMTLYIGTAAGLADVAVFRVREDVASTGAVSVGEFGTNDTGAVAFVNPTAIAANQYITIIDARNPYAAYPRIDYAGGTTASIYEDYNLGTVTPNLLPSPVVRIKTNNSRGGYFATKVRDGQTVAITAVATVEHWPSSSSATYAWSYPAGFTSVSGASTATLTATAPVGNHIISCTVTPNYGAPFTAYRRVHIHDDTTNPAILITQISGDSRNRTARRITLDLNDDRIADIIDGNMVMVFDVATWNGSDVPTATTLFVGWMSRASYSSSGGLRQGTAEIIGVGELLNQLTNTSQLFEVANVPTTWQQMGYNLATYNWVIWWLLTYRARRLLEIINFHPYSTSASVGRMPSFDVGAGTILSQCQSLAQRYHKGMIGANSGGELFVTVHPSMIEVASRGSLITRMALTASKFSGASYARDIRPRVRQVEGSAFTWDGASALPTPLKAITPERPGQGNNDETLGEQIVASQSELNAITGLYYNYVNNPIQSVTITVPKNCDVIEPSEMTLVNVTIPATIAPTGVAWQFDAVPVSVNKRYLPNGATDIELTVEPVTSGAAGSSVPVPPPGENIVPDLPPIDDVFPIDPFPDWGPELPIDPGDPTPLDPQPDANDEYPDIYLGTDDGYAAKATNGVFTDISPSSGLRAIVGTVFQLVQDGWNYSVGYMVGSTAILRCNAITTTPAWTSLLTYTSNIEDVDNGGGSHTTTIDFSSGGGGFTQSYTIYRSGVGAYSPETPVNSLNYANGGWTTIESQHPSAVLLGYSSQELNIARVVDADATLTEMKLWWTPLGSNHEATMTVRVMVNNVNAGGYGGPVNISSGSPATIALNIPVERGDYIGWSVYYSASVAPVDPTVFTKIEWTATITGDPMIGTTDERIVGAFQNYLNKEKAYCWLSKKAVSGTDYVFFNRTLDNFSTRQQVQIAKYAANMNYSIATSPHNWRFVWVTAGDPGDDAYVYKSSDGGGSFTVTACALYTHGGQLWWNWSTGTPNTPNTTSANLLIVRGLNGSNNYLIRTSIVGSDVTIANGSGKYGLSPLSLYQLPRDGDYVAVAMQDGSVYKSSNFATSFSAGTSVTGTQVYGLWRWPTDSAFALLYGEETLSYTVDTFSAYTDMWSDYSTFATGTFGGDGQTIVSAWIDLGQHYIRPVASEA